jgi:hypothetical protein
MDGWMGGWVGGWMDGWMDGSMMDGCIPLMIALGQGERRGMGRSSLPGLGEGAETGGESGRGVVTDREHALGRLREGDGAVSGVRREGAWTYVERAEPGAVQMALFEWDQQERGRDGQSIGAHIVSHTECRSGWVRVGAHRRTWNGGGQFEWGRQAGRCERGQVWWRARRAGKGT